MADILESLQRTSVKICFGALLTLAVSPVAAQNPNPGVVPPNAAPQGLTYGEWSARWIKWAYEPVPSKNPIVDLTGANCAEGQSGHVWFLAGTLNAGTVTRHCTIPAGRMLFFPVGNGFCAGDGLDFAGERDCATGFAAALGNYRVEVDGVPIKALDRPLLENYYRALSPEYELRLQSDNIFNADAGKYKPGAADGVYLMLTPLPPGKHTIHIHADFISGDDVGKQIDATYYLTVGR